MNLSLNSLKQWFGGNAAIMQGAAAPMLVVAILSMMVLPLPPWVLDTFFTFNISVALMVMMVAALSLIHIYGDDAAIGLIKRVNPLLVGVAEPLKSGVILFR